MIDYTFFLKFTKFFNFRLKNSCCRAMSASPVSFADKLASEHVKESKIESSTTEIFPTNESDDALDLLRDRAAPIYAIPRGPGKKVYKTEIGENGRRLANYVLFEDSMEKCQITNADYTNLNSEERDIYMRHLKAVRERHLNYKDPKTGYVVMTVSQLLLNGKCCGNGCRHCPYQHQNAPLEIKNKRKWNGAFYV